MLESKVIIRHYKATELINYIFNSLLIDPENYAKKTRERTHVFARQLFCYYCVDKLNYGKSELGMFLNQTHATIIHSAKKIKELKDVNDKYIVNYLKYNEHQILEICKKKLENCKINVVYL